MPEHPRPGRAQHTADPGSKAKSLEVSVRQLTDEAAGLFNLHIVRIADYPEVAVSARLGDPIGNALLLGIERVMRAACRFEKPQCASCDAVFFPKRPAVGVLLIVPAIDAPTMTIASGICPACALKSDDEIVAAFTAYARRGLWPDLRTFKSDRISRNTGRA